MAGPELERELRLQMSQARRHIVAAYEDGDEFASEAYGCRLRDLIELAARFGVHSTRS